MANVMEKSVRSTFSIDSLLERKLVQSSDNDDSEQVPEHATAKDSDGEEEEEEEEEDERKSETSSSKSEEISPEAAAQTQFVQVRPSFA